MSLVNHLVVFAKAPRLGRVKSRLAEDIGPLGALAFYRRVLIHVTRPLIQDRRWQCWLAVTPDASIHADGLWPRDCSRISQGPGDLGQRMGGVAEVLPPGPVVIIGADIPAVRPHHINKAFRELGRHDAVFGPADDGGYWLVGLKRRPVYKQIFQNVRWSTEHALADTVANLAPGQTHAVLDTLDDIDDGEAYRRLRQMKG
ncbi:MAG: glycosyltransferase [Rhodospirillales bacterium]|nr:glycosyltransferase [Rhodospirillales bacterium]